MQCPLCHSPKTSKKKLIEVEPVVALWRDYYGIDIKSEFRGVKQMELWGCMDCFIGFFSPRWLAGSAQMYCQLGNCGFYYAAQKWEYDAALEDLRSRQRILEIGCGSGSFMVLAKARGLFVEGLEQNGDAISQATKRGLPVIEATAEDVARQSPGMYDAVCSFQVLEHVVNPKEFLDACCILLRPGGLLVLGVPNQDSYVRHMVNPLDMPPHHMTRWTRRPLNRIQSYFPLKVIRIACEPLPDNQIELYVNTYTSFLRRRNLGFLVRPSIDSRIVHVMRRFRLSSFLRGQNIYVCYVRN
jgi:2-polyprenyl-3-methyl-5-hydroxy-6-metoxy-1,4-benzoquinol methylase